MAVSVPNVDLMERVSHLTNKIYREMLYITRLGRMSIITMGGLYHIPLGLIPFSPSPTPTPTPTRKLETVLSWELLTWISVKGRIPCSFTNFITTPELSGSLYISPDIYHSQIAEYLLEKIYQCR